MCEYREKQIRFKITCVTNPTINCVLRNIQQYIITNTVAAAAVAFSFNFHYLVYLLCTHVMINC